MGEWWKCPNDPPCPHGAVLHDVDELDDPLPRCCAEGCDCGASAPVAPVEADRLAQYERAVADGLSHAEAAEVGWPSVSPDEERWKPNAATPEPVGWGMPCSRCLDEPCSCAPPPGQNADQPDRPRA